MGHANGCGAGQVTVTDAVFFWAPSGPAPWGVELIHTSRFDGVPHVAGAGSTFRLVLPRMSSLNTARPAQR